MLKTQLSPQAKIHEIAHLNTVMPVKKTLINPRLPLIIIQYVNGRVSVLRIPDGSVVFMCKSVSVNSQISWSADSQKVYILDDNGTLYEYSLDNTHFDRRLAANGTVFACTDHVIAVKYSNGVKLSSLTHPLHNTDGEELEGVMDILAGRDCIYMLHKDESGLMARKYNITVSGDVQYYNHLQTQYDVIVEEKQKLIKYIEQLVVTLQKWRNSAFIDFISVQQLCHFFLKYDAKNLKRDANELQRLEVLFKDGVEAISDLLADDDEDWLQSLSRSMSRLTKLLRGADDLELMSIRLKDVIEDVKLVSTDFNFFTRLVLSKCELRLSEAKVRVDSSQVSLKVSFAFECRFSGDHFDDYCCIDEDLFVVTKTADNPEWTIYKNNEECKRLLLEGCTGIHIASHDCFVAKSEAGRSSVFTANGTSIALDNMPSAISGRHGIISCLNDDYTVRVFDLSPPL